MNAQEYEALDNIELTPFAVTLYIRCFRRYMNYADGTVSLAESLMKQSMEYVPPRGSKQPSEKPTRQKIRTAVEQLYRAGLVELLRKGDIKEGRTPLFLCRLATSDLVRPNEEQPRNNQGTTNYPKSSNITNINAFKSFDTLSQKTEEQPKTDYTDLEKREIACAREHLEYSQQWAWTAQANGLQVSEDEIKTIFEKWRDSDSVNVIRANTQHIRLWQNYCKAIAKQNQAQQNQSFGGSHGQSQRPVKTSNVTANTLQDCIQRASAGIGTDDFDFSQNANGSGQ